MAFGTALASGAGMATAAALAGEFFRAEVAVYSGWRANLASPPKAGFAGRRYTAM
jgi:hypothetical protein